jgi:hypothetical protein
VSFELYLKCLASIFAPVNVRHVTLETRVEMYVKSFRYFGPVLTEIEIFGELYLNSPLENAVTFSLG